MRGIKVIASERYNRADTSVTGQVLKIIAANPDAVFIGATASPATLPQLALLERGFKGQVYHTHGIIGPDFLRVGGKSVEGAIAPSGPLIVADQLPDTNPIKGVSLAFFKDYEGRYPQVRNGFAGYAYDTFLLVQAAIPGAVAKATPGTPEFRQAMRELAGSYQGAGWYPRRLQHVAAGSQRRRQACACPGARAGRHVQTLPIAR